MLAEKLRIVFDFWYVRADFVTRADKSGVFYPGDHAALVHGGFDEIRVQSGAVRVLRLEDTPER